MESQGALSQVGVDGAPQLGRLQEQREESQHGLVGWTDREQLRDRERERERQLMRIIADHFIVGQLCYSV